MPHEESEKLLNELMEHATQPQFIHTHRWRVHDLVMWDNRCTMHRGTEYDTSGAGSATCTAPPSRTSAIPARPDPAGRSVGAQSTIAWLTRALIT